MKGVRKLLAAALASLLLSAPIHKAMAQTAAAVSFQVFYDNLSPYGKWIQDAGYGYVWVPSQQGFRPYFSNGYWVMTEYGSTWVSTYPWGWAPFHYGRWTFDDFYGWVWIPGTDWGPAWVVWLSGGDYYGWSPMQPGGRINIVMSPGYYTPADWWVFIPRTALLNPAFSHSYKGAGNNTNILKTTSVINNTEVNNGITYVTGPRASEFARATNQHAAIYDIKSAGKPGKMMVTKNEISLYRPLIAVNNNVNKPAPATFSRAEHAIGKAYPIASGHTGSQKATPASTGKKHSGKHQNQKGS